MDQIVTLRPLKELALLKSAEAFENSQIQIPAGKLSPEENNGIFEKLTKYIILENSDRIIENFNITRIKLGFRDLKTDLLKIAHSMNLEHFELNLERPFTFEDNTKFDLPSALTACLNPESQRKLKKLKIEGPTDIARGWVKKLCQLVPNLQSLSIQRFPITKYEFRTICGSLKFLTTLDISEMKIQTLNGISKLQSLKNLIMISAYCPDLRDLFNLENLEYLDLSLHYEHSRHTSFDCYMEPGKSLPSLKVLDCSMNHMKQEELNLFLETHPNIETIGYLYNRIYALTEMNPNRKVIFLTCENLEKSLDSLKYYMDFLNIWRVSMILDSILKFLKNKYDEQSKEKIQRCFTIMVELLKKHGRTKGPPPTEEMSLAGNYRRQWQRTIVECLFEILKSGRSKMLTTDQKRELLKALLYDEIAGCLQILQIEDILFNSMDHMDQICNHSARLIAKYNGNIDAGWLTLIMMSVEKLGNNWLRRMCWTHPEFQKSIFLHVHDRSMYNFYLPFDESRMLRLLESIEMAGILTRSIYNHQHVVNTLIDVFTDRAKFEFWCQPIRSAIVRELRRTVIEKGRSFEHIFSEKIYPTWLSMFPSQCMNYSRKALELYVTFMVHETHRSIYDSWEEIGRIIAEIQSSIDNFARADGKIDDIVSRLVEDPQAPPKAKNWAIWVKNHRDKIIAKVGEPEKKKRKLAN
ncbi:hypothetical protein B9Z55_008911 [Caenorhabditis nigoni]|uniref:Uncharacterized protein n=2 Tax=Caenorhabditis nigoni TaxID=1611254 RepID=A0A2G5UQ00_9PELO|nr:hypothetical protein B9Z55_008911 [Caenorhabditis nigoni]